MREGLQIREEHTGEMSGVLPARLTSHGSHAPGFSHQTSLLRKNFGESRLQLRTTVAPRRKSLWSLCMGPPESSSKGRMGSAHLSSILENTWPLPCALHQKAARSECRLYCCHSPKRRLCGPGAVAQWLRAFAALSEEVSLDSSDHAGWLATICNSSCRDPTSLLASMGT